MKYILQLVLLCLFVLSSSETFARKLRSDVGKHHNHYVNKHKQHKESSGNISKERQDILDSLGLFSMTTYKGDLNSIKELPLDSNKFMDFYFVGEGDNVETYYWYNTRWINHEVWDSLTKDLETKYINWVPKKEESLQLNEDEKNKQMIKGVVLLLIIIVSVILYKKFKK